MKLLKGFIKTTHRYSLSWYIGSDVGVTVTEVPGHAKRYGVYSNAVVKEEYLLAHNYNPIRIGEYETN